MNNRVRSNIVAKILDRFLMRTKLLLFYRFFPPSQENNHILLKHQCIRQFSKKKTKFLDSPQPHTRNQRYRRQLNIDNMGQHRNLPLFKSKSSCKTQFLVVMSKQCHKDKLNLNLFGMTTRGSSLFWGDSLRTLCSKVSILISKLIFIAL